MLPQASVSRPSFQTTAWDENRASTATRVSGATRLLRRWNSDSSPSSGSDAAASSTSAAVRSAVSGVLGVALAAGSATATSVVVDSGPVVPRPGPAVDASVEVSVPGEVVASLGAGSRSNRSSCTGWRGGLGQCLGRRAGQIAGAE